MKVGDNIAVSIGGHVVAQAKVAEIADGRATLVVPGTVVVMAIRTELDRAPSEGAEHIVTGVDRPVAEEAPRETTPPVETESEKTNDEAQS